MNTDYLYQSWEQLNKRSAAGIDGIKPDAYQRQLHRNILSLSEQLKHKSYRASGIKRVFIPKANGKQRPLGLPTIDDKVVQQGLSQILQSIWEQDFLPNSYGYRSDKSAHQACKRLKMNLQYGKFGLYC